MQYLRPSLAVAGLFLLAACGGSKDSTGAFEAGTKNQTDAIEAQAENLEKQADETVNGIAQGLENEVDVLKNRANGVERNDQ